MSQKLTKIQIFGENHRSEVNLQPSHRLHPTLTRTESAQRAQLATRDGRSISPSRNLRRNGRSTRLDGAPVPLPHGGARSTRVKSCERCGPLLATGDYSTVNVGKQRARAATSEQMLNISSEKWCINGEETLMLSTSWRRTRRTFSRERNNEESKNYVPEPHRKKF